MPVQYIEILFRCKNKKFLLTNFDIFNIYAQNIHDDCWNPQSTHNVCFGSKNKKIRYTPANPSFSI